MEGLNFEQYARVYRNLVWEYLALPAVSRQEIRFNDNSFFPDDKSSSLPTVSLRFNLRSEEEFWYRRGHNSTRLEHAAARENPRIEMKSHYLKLDPREYMSYDMFYNVLKENLINWGRKFTNYHHRVIHGLIDRVYSELNKATPPCQNLDMFIGLTLKIDYIVDYRRLRFNNGMVPASNSSIMELPQRMEIDEDEDLNDDCVICLEQLGKERKKILCMPCSHMFHGDCITTWLETSHYCPVCRYDMPTTSG